MLKIYPCIRIKNFHMFVQISWGVTSRLAKLDLATGSGVLSQHPLLLLWKKMAPAAPPRLLIFHRCAIFFMCFNQKKLPHLCNFSYSIFCVCYFVSFFHLCPHLPRVSKSGRHADARLRKILAFERKTVKITSFNLILLISLFLCCVAFPAHFHAQFIWLDILPA